MDEAGANLRRSHRAALDHQEDLPPERLGERGAQPDGEKADRLEGERQPEREEGIAARRRGSAAAPSDRPENEPPHPQDVNEIGDAH